MTNLQTTQTAIDEAEILKKVITKGDLSDLTPAEQVIYYIKICQRHKLDPYSKPFDLIEFTDKKGRKKVHLYGNKECASQLRTDRAVSIYKLDEVEENGYYKVTAYARTPDGREDLDKGITFVRGLTGESYSSAVKMAITQAKRRVTLSICGLGCLDETEVDSLPNARTVDTELTDDDLDFELELKPRDKDKGSGLDQWLCGRALAMKILTLSANLKARHITKEIVKSWLPSGVTSRKDLDEELAREFIENLSLRIKLIEICSALSSKGVDNDTMRLRLPGGVGSLKDLSFPQVGEAIKAFTHWLNSYNEVVLNGEVA